MGITKSSNFERCLCPGADKLYLISDPLFAGSDTYATSHIHSTLYENKEPFIVF